MEILLTMLSGAVAFNNRATEAFKMYLRDKTKVDDETRRILQVIFSWFVGIVTVGVMVFGGISFRGTPLAPFADSPLLLSFVGGSMVSFGGAFAQPILELVAAIGGIASYRMADSPSDPAYDPETKEDPLG